MIIWRYIYSLRWGFRASKIVWAIPLLNRGYSSDEVNWNFHSEYNKIKIS
jgi:hypothetical protein